LEFLLGFDGRIHHLEGGYWLKFDIKKVAGSSERPHGLRYSFTMHDPQGRRLVGFDNAHQTPRTGNPYRKRSIAYDHWHRRQNDEGQPYDFISAEQLLMDFESEVRRVLSEMNVDSNLEP
jgi:hypothetical protein